MGMNEIKLDEEEEHGEEPWSLAQRAICCVKIWTCWRGENPSLSPLQNVLKLPGKCGRRLVFKQCTRNSWCPISLLPCYCYLLQTLRIETEKTNSVLPSISELEEGGKSKYPKRVSENKWKFSCPVFSKNLSKMLLHCHLLVQVSIEPCLPLEAKNRIDEVIAD